MVSLYDGQPVPKVIDFGVDAEADLDAEVGCTLALEPRSDQELDPAFQSDLQARLVAHLSAQPWCVPGGVRARLDLSEDGADLWVGVTARVPGSHGTLHPSELDLAGIPVKARLDAALTAVFGGLVRREEVSRDFVAPGLFTERYELVLYENHETTHLAGDFALALEEFERLVPGGTVTSLEMSLEAGGSESEETSSRLTGAEVTVVTRKAWGR